MKRILRVFCLTFSLITCSWSNAQAPAMTIGAVSSALQDALASFNLAIETAGAEVRSSGASLAGNAQNVITDIDRQLGARLTTSIDKLSGAERQLADDAILLTKQIKEASLAVAGKTGDEARRTIAEADITAYNASYSLPCRTLTPRIIYSFPQSIRRGSGPAEVHLRGNFLDIGAIPNVKISGESAEIIGRSRNELVVRIPTKVISGIKNSTSVQVLVDAEENRRTNLWLYCYERTVRLPTPLTAAQLLRPELNYKVTIDIKGSYDALEPLSTNTHYGRIDENHEASFDDNHQICLPADYVLNPSAPPVLQIESVNCNSSVGTPLIAGERCVIVPAHLGGCGVRRVLGAVVDHRGRGWFSYNVTLNGVRKVPASIASQSFVLESPNGIQRTFTATHPDAAKNLLNARWEYAVNAQISEGTEPIRNVVAGSANPNPDGLTTRFNNGVAFVEIGNSF